MKVRERLPLPHVLQPPLAHHEVPSYSFTAVDAVYKFKLFHIYLFIMEVKLQMLSPEFH